MSYKKRAIKGVSWNLLSYILTIPVAYGIRVLYAHELPKEDVGLFYALLDLFSIFAIFRGLGVNAGIVRFIPKYLVKKEYGILKSLILFGGIFNFFSTLLMTLIIVLLAPFIIKIYFHNSNLDYNFIYLCFVIIAIGFYFFDSIFGYISRVLQGFQKYFYLSLTKIFRIYLIFLFSLILIFIFNINNTLTPTISYSLYPIILTLIFGTILLKETKSLFNIKTSFNINSLKELISYSSFIMLNSVGGLILGYMDGVCLNLFRGLNVVADYRNVAMPITNIIIYISTSIITVLFPMISELWEKGDKKILCYGIEKAYLYILAIGLPISLLLFVFPIIVINLLFGLNYITASEIIRVLSFSALFSSLSSLGFNILNAIGKVKTSNKVLYIGAFLNLVLNLLLIPLFGGVGAGIATLFSYFVMVLIQVYLIVKFLENNFLSVKFLKLIVVNIVSLLLVTTIKDIGLFGGYNIIIQIIFYFGMYLSLYMIGILKLKIINIKELKI